MSKTVTAEPAASQANGTKRQRKKQAKQEAKVMLKIEQAKKGLKKAQKKFISAQVNLDENQAHLHGLEEKLQQIRTTGEPQSQAPQTLAAASSETQPEAAQTQEVIDAVYQEPLLVSAAPAPEADTAAIEAFHNASIVPAEGRDDVASAQDTAQTQEAEQSAQQVIDAQTPATSEPIEVQADITTDTAPDASAQEEPTPESANL
jgi:hypothetical protein